MLFIVFLLSFNYYIYLIILLFFVLIKFIFFTIFLNKIYFRFKLLSNKTFPVWTGDQKQGTITILNECNIDKSEYELGVTKGNKFLVTFHVTYNSF